MSHVHDIRRFFRHIFAVVCIFITFCMCGYWVIMTQLFSPSLGGMILGQTLPFTLLGIVLVSTHGDSSMGFLSELPLVYLCNCAGFYIFQWRELRRFYEQIEVKS